MLLNTSNLAGRVLTFCVVIAEGGTPGPADIAALDSHDMTSLSDNIDSTDDLVPSLHVSICFICICAVETIYNRIK